ncbi:MAG: hypothetical protein HY820_30130 [Acidobacteria bacterium]|nr:hypothetical protein [Acidobacteriota bacterium]
MSRNRLSYYVVPIVVVLGAIGLAIVGMAQTDEAASEPKGSEAPWSPAFRSFKALYAAGGYDKRTGSGQPLGLIPTPSDMSHLRRLGAPPRVPGITLPPTYDLRGLGRLPAIRNQGNCGSCWAFAVMGSTESALLPGSVNDFSENHMKNTAGFDWTPCDGGNAHMAMAYAARWSGIVKESEDPYQAVDANTSPATVQIARHLQDAVLVPRRANSTDNDGWKDAVMQYGAIYVHMMMDDVNYYNSTNKSYYYSGNKSINHAVAIVGWDDNFDRNKFNVPPQANGAFIVRNSWGGNWGDNGYFYVSYYDSAFGRTSDMWAFAGTEDATNFTRAYQYDDLGWVSSYGYSSNTAWFANVFAASASEAVSAVSFYVGSPASPYTIRIYTNVQGNPSNGVLAGTTTGTSATAGYHTIRLAAPVNVTSGSNFSVVVQLQTPGFNYPIPIEYAIPNYSSRASSRAGQSYISSNGSTWTDLTTRYSTGNVCVKVFATGATTPNAVPVTITTNPPGLNVMVDGATYTAPKLFSNWTAGGSHSVTVPSTQGSSGTRYVYAGWSDNGAQTHNIVTPAAAATFTATFNTQFQLTTSVTPAGGGTVTANPASADGYYASGALVQLTAMPSAGFALNNWTGDASGTTSPVSTSMGVPRTVTANFRTLSSNTVTSNPPGLSIVVDGTTYTAPQSFNWTNGTTHSVSAPTSQGSGGIRYVYANWSDGGAQSHTVTASAGAAFTAGYTTQYLLTTTVNPAGAGSITATPTSPDGYFNSNTSVLLRAVPNGGFSFSSWSASLAGSVNPQSVAMTAARTVTASFAAPTGGVVNDEPAGAVTITGIPYSVSQATLGATQGIADPVHACTSAKDTKSVWYRYFVTSPGALRIDTYGSDYDTVLSVYDGLVADTREMACNDDPPDQSTVNSAVTVVVTMGQQLYIQVSAVGDSAIGGNAFLNVRSQATVVSNNDESNTAAVISSLPYNATQSTASATTNNLDPIHSCTSSQDGHTVWFRYVSNFSGTLRVNTIGSSYDTVLAIYGGFASAGNELRCNDDGNSLSYQSDTSVTVTSGQTYWIQVSSYQASAGGTLMLNVLATGIAVPNDEISTAVAIPSLPYTIQQDITRATASATDPGHSCESNFKGLRTVWFRVVPTFTGTLNVNTYGSEYDTVLSVYRTNVSQANEVACSDDANGATYSSAAAVSVTAGQTYYIEVSEYDDFTPGNGGLMVLNVSAANQSSAFTNDEPSTATRISSLPFTSSVSTLQATINAGDPVHSCTTGRTDSATAWYIYTASYTGTLNINAQGSDYYTVLSAYSGTPSAATELACSANWTTTPRSQITIPVIQGQTYYIEASAWNISGAGQLVLSATQGTTAPPFTPTAMRFVPMTPCRILETRAQYAGTTWSGNYGPPSLAAGAVRTIPVTASPNCAIPASAKAFVLNATLDTLINATGPVDTLTLWPTGEARPEFRTLATTTGGYIANTAIVRAGTGGSISVYSSNSTNLALDIFGYFTDDANSGGLLYYPIGPCRAVDTRGPIYSQLPQPYGNQRMNRSETRTFRIPGSPIRTANCQIPAANAYSLQMTLAPGELTDGAPVAYVTAWPTGQTQPVISNTNSVFGYALANSAIVPARVSDGSINVFAYDATNLILDVNGYFAPDDGTGRGLSFYPVPQCRFLNTQDTSFTGAFGGPVMTPGTDRTVTLPASTRCPGLPTGPQAWAINATATPGGQGMPFLSMWPAGVVWPGVSQLNAFQGQTVSNSAIVPGSTSGSINIKVAGTTHVALEITGYFSR